MTMPHERLRALQWAGELVRELAHKVSQYQALLGEEEAEQLRRQAITILRHYPSAHELTSAAQCTYPMPNWIGLDPFKTGAAPFDNGPEANIAVLENVLNRLHRGLIWCTTDGTLISGEEFATRSGMSTQDLAGAESRNELFSFLVGGKHWYLADLLEIGAEATAELCRALAGLDPASKLIFFRRKHDGLGDKTVGQAVGEGNLARALELALVWRES